jgi:thymidylate synthase (FAD)
MKVTTHSYKILSKLPGVDDLKALELIGRNCYKSEGKVTENSYERFLSMLIERGHEGILEHESITVRFITDRAVSHQLVRHRLCSFAQESQRYCNYSKYGFGSNVTFVKPSLFDEGTPAYAEWYSQCEAAEKSYFRLLDIGVKPEDARSVLPNCTKTEIIMTANLRQWRHMFRMRTDPAAQYEIRALMQCLLMQFKSQIPIIFDDL